MKIIAYYEGSPNVQGWLQSLLPDHEFNFRKLPTTNRNSEFVKLPAYVADILYLDKPDLILSGSLDGVHERPLLSLDFAECTPQYQHALQRFPRMLAAVANGCPGAIVMPLRKRENSGGVRLYERSQALEFGTVRLMDVYRTPAVVFDWPDEDGDVLHDPTYGGYPPLKHPKTQEIKEFIEEAIRHFSNIDYIGALNRSPSIVEATHRMRARAYEGHHPKIERPGGGSGTRPSQSRLQLQTTADLLDDVQRRSPNHRRMLQGIPDFISNRPSSLVFWPTRVVQHAGDPYVGMLAYYDIAFCRIGTGTRDRRYNLVADCRTVRLSELTETMARYNNEICPFGREVADVSFYSFHLKNGCRHIKAKPIRIYGELVDLIVFQDGCIYGVG